MPGFDGRGPRGFGPGTGRGMGPCMRETTPRRGRGPRGFGLGRGIGPYMRRFMTRRGRGPEYGFGPQRAGWDPEAWEEDLPEEKDR
ncbi:MAG: DUF5320 family protein [Candidatus Paceibacterota bacterium]